MNNIDKFSDEELINYVYETSIEINQPNEVTDWSDWRQWKYSTSQLSVDAQKAWRIVTLHSQVINGGFIQYFDNRYAIYAYETLQDLEDINASKIFKLLSEVLKIMNPENLRDKDFFDYVYEQQYETNWEDLARQLDPPTKIYYRFDEPHEAIVNLAKFLRSHTQ